MDRHGPFFCALCRGQSCWGGGNKGCVQRDPRPSILAGILDSYGGLRSVVTYEDRVCAHVRPDEIAIVVPNLTVHEPIAWGDIPYVIARIKLEVDRWIEQIAIPNEDHIREAVAMYQLHKLRHPSAQGSIHLPDIVYT